MARQVQSKAEQGQAREVVEQYTDFVDQAQRVYAYGYYLDAIEKIGSHIFLEHLREALLLAIMDIADSKSKRIRERAFTVWSGPYNAQFWVAVPHRLSVDVNKIIVRHLNAVEGYYGTDYGSNAQMTLTPYLHYDYGEVTIYGDYTEPDAVGKIDVKGRSEPTWVNIRQWQPAPSLQDECYSGLLHKPPGDRGKG